jgi:hypothetical protein
MRSVLTMVLVASLVLVAGMASAAQPVGQVPNTTLADLGLGGMQQMNDIQGTSIRGSGFATIGGYTFANSLGSGAASTYQATSATNRALAAGGSLSVAASGIGVITPNGNGAIIIGTAAIGGAFAYGK